MSDREKKVSAARRRAEQHTSGIETTVLRVPEGVGFFEFKPGVHRLEILPYKVKKGSNVPGGNPFAEAGILYFERTFYVYKSIGPNEKSYVALGKTFGKPDPIAEYRQEASRGELTKEQKDYIKSLNPKERQIFLVVDRDHVDKGIQVLESSNFCFGALLDSRVKNSTEEEGWDLFYFPDEDGMTLRVTVEEIDGGGFSFNKATAIDFIKRSKPLPDKFVNHGIDLDDMLVETPYEELNALFLGVNPGSKGGDSSEKKEDKKKEADPFEDDVPSKGSEKQKDADPPKQEKKEEPKKPKFSKGDEVLFEGGKWTIFKLNEDSGVATLCDADDNLKKAELSDLKPFESKKEEKPKEEEKKKWKTAEECGMKNGTEVTYEGEKCSILRISGDGTSMILVRDKDDETIKGVAPEDCKLYKAESKKEEKPKEDVKQEQASKSKKSADPSEGDDDWDADWDK